MLVHWWLSRGLEGTSYESPDSVPSLAAAGVESSPTSAATPSSAAPSETPPPDCDPTVEVKGHVE